jgi:hypothetical protein
MTDDAVYDDPELAAQEAAIAEQIARLADARAEVQSQTRGLETDIGSFRTEQRLAADAAHTATVELATAQGGDFYASDVGQQVAPDGTVTYDFQDVHIKAAGIDFDAFGGPGATQTRIDWKRLADGAVIAEIVSYDNPATVGELLLRAFDPPQTLQAQTRHAINHTANLATVSAEAVNGGSDQIRTIIDSTGGSSFVQRAGAPAFTRVDFGAATITVPATFTSASGTVPHGLGVTPRAVILTPATAFFGSYVGSKLAVPSATNTAFGVHVSSDPYSGGVAVNFYWFAIG